MTEDTDRLAALEGRILTALDDLRTELRTELQVQGHKVDKLDLDIQRSNDRLETYQKASDNLIRLATTIVAGASAIVILAPLARVAAEFSFRALGFQ